jgi:hypothetical protein
MLYAEAGVYLRLPNAFRVSSIFGPATHRVEQLDVGHVQFP